MDASGKPVVNLGSPGTPGIVEFTQLPLGVESVTQVPGESVDFEGRPVACQVLDVVYRRGGSYRLWIDQNRHWVLSLLIRPDWTFAVTSMRVNQPPPQWLVDVAPKFAGSELPSWVGRLAPGFQLDSLDGKPVSLAGLRGKVVLLNF